MTCTNASHAAAVSNDDTWSMLKPIGTQQVDERESLELRNCACGSTLARVVYTPWHTEVIEHVAVFAAEHGDGELEQLCDDVLAGDTSEELVLSIVDGSTELQEWCARRCRRRAR